MPLLSIRATPMDKIICHKLIIGKKWNKFSSLKPQYPELVSMQQCYMMPYIDSANDAPGRQNGPIPGDISSQILTMGKTYKNLLRNHESRSLYILCVAMLSNL